MLAFSEYLRVQVGPGLLFNNKNMALFNNDSWKWKVPTAGTLGFAALFTGGSYAESARNGEIAAAAQRGVTEPFFSSHSFYDDLAAASYSLSLIAVLITVGGLLMWNLRDERNA
jgi:hypothetical protein